MEMSTSKININTDTYLTKSSDAKLYISGYEVYFKRTNFRQKEIEKFKDLTIEKIFSYIDLKNTEPRNSYG